MRILHITSHLDPGGVTSYVANLAAGLVVKGHRVSVASGGGLLESELAARGVSTHRAALRTSAEFSPQASWAGWQLSELVRRVGFDVLHAHTRIAQVCADKLSRRHRIPYVTTWHGFFRRRLGRAWWPCTGDRTIAISEPVAAHLRDVFRVPSARIALVPNGVDMARFSQPVDAAAVAAFRRQWDLPDGAPVVGTVSRLVPSKGVDQLVDAFREVVAGAPAARLVIVGDGPDWMRLKVHAARAQLEGSIRFVGPMADTRPAMAAMSVFAFLPADKEGFGLALLEAMAAGLPIVAVKRGVGATWLLEDSHAGLLVEPDQPSLLAGALGRVLGDDAYRQHLAAESRSAAVRYDLSRVITQIEKIYEQLIRHP